MTVETSEEELVVSDKKAVEIAKAISSETRWEILKIIRERKIDVSRIAETLNQTEANISAQIKILEKAGLIRSYYSPGQHGVKKVCEPAVKRVVIIISD